MRHRCGLQTERWKQPDGIRGILEQKKPGRAKSWAHVIGSLHARDLGPKSRHEAPIANKLCMSCQQIVPSIQKYQTMTCDGSEEEGGA